MKYKTEDYIESGFYGTDDTEIESYKSKVVKCRKPHFCGGGCNIEIQPKDYALRETGFMDGEPISAYTCLPCLDKWLDDINSVEEYEDEDDT